MRRPTGSIPRPNQGLAARRLSADSCRHQDAEPHNPENFFAQIAQAAFSSGNTVPGIGLSPDKMLLGPAFAYNDAQRNRIGTNFHQLPVNRPKVPVNTYMVDGQMVFVHAGNAPVYAAQGGRNR
jgi:catalase